MAPVMKQFWSNNLLAVFAAIILISCSSNHNSSELFRDKYSSEVQKINSARIETPTEKKEVITSYPPTPDEVQALYSSQDNSNKYSYVDVDQFADKKYLPDKDYYEQMKIYNPSNTLPDDLFATRYNTVLASKFRRTGSEFDKIKMLPYDAYGISSTLSQKNYVMIGNNNLQSSLDTTLDNRSRRDLLASRTLIKEQREVRQKQRMAKYLGDDETLLKVEDEAEKKSSKSAAKTDDKNKSSDTTKNVANPSTKKDIKN
jgi:hypothetical protein